MIDCIKEGSLNITKPEIKCILSTLNSNCCEDVTLRLLSKKYFS